MSTLSEKPALSSKGTVKQEPQQDIQAAKSPSFSGLRSLVAGGLGGIFAVISGHPFDLVKVRLQTAQKGVYSGAFDVVRKTTAREGMARGLYAGVSAPLIGVTPMFAVSFWGFDVGKNIVRRIATVHDNQMSIAQISFAGFFSAIPMMLITAPFERVKVLLQIQGQTGEKKYSSGMDVVRQLYKEGGVRSVFRGTAATLARDGPGSAAYFATYEYIKRCLTPDGGRKLGMGAVMVAGGAAGMAMWLLVFPVDTVKSRLQSAGGKPTIGGVLRGIHGSGGLKAFFPGLGPALARSIPANSMCFLGVELAHRMMDKTFA
ncbi:mitochondrial carrier [Tuber magnatum]|uniref:Mitochondrial carrier n=1 Tax=Tuber magnatum TaxID=42249 RepID=A0A317SHX3_9PEZI|nr:mitochondrial carrier [Tuber magnatum]